jgi:energy-coupling factor transporter transmembrane protein EcfT
MPRSRLAAIDPRVKLVWALALLVATLVFTDLRTLVLLLGSIAVVAAIGGVLGETIRRLRRLTTIIVVASLLIFGFVVPGITIVTLPSGLTFTWDGLLVGFISALRIIVVAASLTIVVVTTDNADLIRALKTLKLHPEFAPLTVGSYALLTFSLLLILVAIVSLIANYDLIAGLLPRLG